MLSRAGAGLTHDIRSFLNLRQRSVQRSRGLARFHGSIERTAAELEVSTDGLERSMTQLAPRAAKG